MIVNVLGREVKIKQATKHVLRTEFLIDALYNQMEEK